MNINRLPTRPVMTVPVPFTINFDDLVLPVFGDDPETIEVFMMVAPDLEIESIRIFLNDQYDGSGIASVQMVQPRDAWDVALPDPQFGDRVTLTDALAFDGTEEGVLYMNIVQSGLRPGRAVYARMTFSAVAIDTWFAEPGLALHGTFFLYAVDEQNLDKLVGANEPDQGFNLSNQPQNYTYLDQTRAQPGD